MLSTPLKLALTAALAFPAAHAQTPQIESTPTPHGPTYTLRVTSREVIVEVSVLDRNHRPVSDLTADDFQIVELPTRLPRKLSSFHIGDPDLEAYHPQPSGGFRVTLGGGCSMSTTFHYQLAYQPSPEGWTPGYHDILITTARPNVTLAYRRRYYVGLTEPPAKPLALKDSDVALRQAACYHPETPPSIALNATAIAGTQQYSLVVQPDSLAFTSLANDSHKVHLDYGACTFDPDGKALSYFHISNERVLTPDDYAKALAQGLPNIFDLHGKGDPAAVRFVVRDRQTGNLGSIVVPTASTREPSRSKAVPEADLTPNQTRADQAAAGNLGWFGSILPRPGTMCGDVYELPPGTESLPRNPTDLNSIGALYTYSLNIPIESIPGGLPGVMQDGEYFDIDYNGVFYVTTPGEYRFRLYSDDGSQLFIDDQRILDLDGHHHIISGERRIVLTPGRHTIHVPYFQGPQAVALILLVRSPNEKDFKVFDLRDFEPTSGKD